MATYVSPGIGSLRRDPSFQPRSQSAGVGSLGNHEIYRKHADSTRLDIRPVVLEARLPRSGMKIERQEYRSGGLPIVFSEISGREQVSVFIPQKGTDGGVLTKKGSPTFYKPTADMKELCEVLYVDPANPKAPAQKAYVRVDAYARKYIQDIGENHKPKKNMNYSFANSVWYLASDIPGSVGSIESVASLRFCGDPGTTGFRVASAGGMLTGAVNYLRAANEMESASRINDVAGKQFALFRYIRSAFEITGGALAATVRSLTLIPQAAKVAATALPILGKIWSYVGIGNSLFLFIPMILKARTASAWMRELDKRMEVGTTEQKAAAGLQFLIDKLELSAKEKDEVLKEAFNRPLYTLVHEEVMLNQDEEEILHRKDREEIAQIIDVMMSRIDPDAFPLISDWEQVRQNLSVRLMKGWAHHKMVHEAEYGRAVGGASLGLLKKEIRGESDLSRQLYYDPKALAEVQALLKTVKEDVNWNWKLTVLTTVTCLLGIAGTIAGMVFTAGTAPFIVGLCVSVLSNILGTGIDLYCFKEDMEGLKDSSYKERVMIILFSLLTVISAVLGGMFYQNAATLAIVVVGSICMLGLNAYAYKLSLDKEKEGQIAAAAAAKKAEETRLNNERERARQQQIFATNWAIHPVF